MVTPTMPGQPNRRLDVPDELRNAMHDLATAYLLERPRDLIEFAVAFFAGRQQARSSPGVAGRTCAGHEALLSTVPMLRTLRECERTRLVEQLTTRTYGPGEQILMEDDTADGLYFVEQGSVSIRIAKEEEQQGQEREEQDDEDDVVELGRVEPGGYFGELTLVTHWPQVASARAVDDVRVAFLDKRAFVMLRELHLKCPRATSGEHLKQIVAIFDSQNNQITIW